jgi:hypothetical protein
MKWKLNGGTKVYRELRKIKVTILPRQLSGALQHLPFAMHIIRFCTCGKNKGKNCIMLSPGIISSERA